jgi:hypothetical protein
MTISVTPHRRQILSREAVLTAWERGFPFHWYSLARGIDTVISKADLPLLMESGVTSIEFVYSHQKKRFIMEVANGIQ